MLAQGGLRPASAIRSPARPRAQRQPACRLQPSRPQPSQAAAQSPGWQPHPPAALLAAWPQPPASPRTGLPPPTCPPCQRRRPSLRSNAAGGESPSPAPPSRPSGAVLASSDEERQTVRESWEKILRWARLSRTAAASEEDVLEHTSKVAVLGGGSFGTAMATLLARNQPSLDVVLLVRDAGTVASVNERHVNERYLPQYVLPGNVRATVDAREALGGADYIVHAIPVQQSSAALAALRDAIAPTTPLLCLSKGLERGSCHNMSELIPLALRRKQPLAVLSGPSFAVELMQGLPTAIVAASEDAALALRVQRLFSSSNLRVNTSADVVGVETAGALKNVLAIAAGIVEGLGLGNNALAALVSQGCSEIRWLAERMGADPLTISGLSGVGDIMLTCFVPLSRNRTVGVRLGKGESLASILASSTQVAEGVATAAAVVVLARRHRVALPVLTAVARIVDGELSPREAVETVMQLPPIPDVTKVPSSPLLAA